MEEDRLEAYSTVVRPNTAADFKAVVIAHIILPCI